MEIRVDDATGPEVVDLITGHLQNMKLHSPPESRHVLGIDVLRTKEVTFWSAWEDGELAGCGALKEIDQHHGEIKSMITSPSYLRKGVASEVLQFIIREAKQRGYHRLSLETGSMDAFEPAKCLYQKLGFQYCDPFAGYQEDPNSVFMTKLL
ncbi:GNAT family N-acetyltransferase [Halobacillus sp. A5]|uniref:GNAT family N-acetyltransferase n=1 Tax=Halobacillus sp. A5 TaxID=2880263 RepID=UPI0020A64332|nr:GNAT family N-acetyltransferase [Halobacillus sp. A5]MCP3028824.1 GNAT family N-acetyltransferase [Halobacillus sp. A5]